MSLFLLAIIVIEMLSLLSAAFVVAMYIKARRGQREFLLGVYAIGADVDQGQYPRELAAALAHISFPFLMWLYVIVTILLCIGTSYLIFFQPHIL